MTKNNRVTFPIIIASVLLLSLGSCVKRCPIAGCQTIHDHTHFFGGELAQDGSAVQKEQIQKSGQLTVYSGLPWYRRIFRKKYTTEDYLKYKRFDNLQHTKKNKQDYNTVLGKKKYP